MPPTIKRVSNLKPQTLNHFIVLRTIPSFCGSPRTSSAFGCDGFALVFWCYVVHLAEIAVGLGWQFAMGTLIGHAFAASHCRVFRHVEIAIVAVPLCFSYTFSPFDLVALHCFEHAVSVVPMATTTNTSKRYFTIFVVMITVSLVSCCL